MFDPRHERSFLQAGEPKEGYEEAKWTNNYKVLHNLTQPALVSPFIYSKFLHIIRNEMLVPYKKIVFMFFKSICKKFRLNEFELGYVCASLKRLNEFGFGSHLMRRLSSCNIYKYFGTDFSLSRRVRQMIKKLFLLVISAKFNLRNFQELNLMNHDFLIECHDFYAEFHQLPQNQVVFARISVSDINEYVEKIQFRHQESLNHLIQTFLAN